MSKGLMSGVKYSIFIWHHLLAVVCIALIAKSDNDIYTKLFFGIVAIRLSMSYYEKFALAEWLASVVESKDGDKFSEMEKILITLGALFQVSMYIVFGIFLSYVI